MRRSCSRSLVVVFVRSLLLSKGFKMVQGYANNKERRAVYIFVATIMFYDKNVPKIIAGSIIGFVGVGYGECFLLKPFE